MTKLAEVVTLYETNSRSVVDQLREAASSIETETDDHDRTVAGIFVQITESGETVIYGWGKLDNDFHAIGYMHAAIDQLLRNRKDGG